MVVRRHLRDPNLSLNCRNSPCPYPISPVSSSLTLCLLNRKVNIIGNLEQFDLPHPILLFQHCIRSQRRVILHDVIVRHIIVSSFLMEPIRSRCHTCELPKLSTEMAVAAESTQKSNLCDRARGFAVTARVALLQQLFRAFDPLLEQILIGRNAKRLLELVAEMELADIEKRCQGCQVNVLVEMFVDIIQYLH